MRSTRVILSNESYTFLQNFTSSDILEKTSDVLEICRTLIHFVIWHNFPSNNLPVIPSSGVPCIMEHSHYIQEKVKDCSNRTSNDEQIQVLAPTVAGTKFVAHGIRYWDSHDVLNVCDKAHHYNNWELQYSDGHASYWRILSWLSV